MDIHPIRTEAEYEAALAEIARLFEATPQTPEGDRLDVLATLVEAYEQQHYSIPTPDPIEALTYYMESRDSPVRTSNHTSATVHESPRCSTGNVPYLWR